MEKIEVRGPAIPLLMKTLREAREGARMRMVDLAKKLDVTQGYISQVETGVSRPSPEYLTKFAEMFSLDARYLLLLGGFVHKDIWQLVAKDPVCVFEFLHSKLNEEGEKICSAN